MKYRPVCLIILSACCVVSSFFYTPVYAASISDTVSSFILDQTAKIPVFPIPDLSGMLSASIGQPIYSFIQNVGYILWIKTGIISMPPDPSESVAVPKDHPIFIQPPPAEQNITNQPPPIVVQGPTGGASSIVSVTSGNFVPWTLFNAKVANLQNQINLIFSGGPNQTIEQQIASLQTITAYTNERLSRIAARGTVSSGSNNSSDFGDSDVSGGDASFTELTVTGGSTLATLTGTSATLSGNVTAAAFYGDGSNLTGISVGSSFSTSTTRSVLSATSPVAYDSSTGIFSVTSGYNIPLTASTTNWESAYTNRITSASAPLSLSNNALSIALASSSANGYLSSTDWSTFNSKGSGTVTSVSGSGGTTGLTLTGGAITSSGTLTLGGTLAVANGGTGVNFMQAGYIPFGNGTSAIATSTSLFWDNSNVRLGLGTITPASTLDLTVTALGTTPADISGFVLANTTAAAAGAQQISPKLRFRGSGWKTTSTAASQTVDFDAYVLPVQGSTAPSGNLLIRSSINGGAYSTGLTLTSAGALTVPGAISAGSLSTGGTIVSGGNFTVNGDSSSFSSGNLTIDLNGNLVANGSLSFGNGAITSSNSNLTVGGNLALTSGDLSVGGTTLSFYNIGLGSGGTATCVGSGSSQGQFYDAGGDLCSTSIRSSKHDIGDLTINALSTVAQMKPAVFTYNDGLYPNKVGPQWGFIADDLELISPKLVEYDKYGKLNQLNLPALISVNTKAIQELNAKIDAFANSYTASPSIISTIQSTLSSMTNFVITKITATLGIFNKVQTDQIQVEQGTTMKDRSTGEYYCVYVDAGVLKNVSGTCDSVFATSSTPSSDNNSDSGNDSADNDDAGDDTPNDDTVNIDTTSTSGVDDSATSTPAESSDNDASADTTGTIPVVDDETTTSGGNITTDTSPVIDDTTTSTDTTNVSTETTETTVPENTDIPAPSVDA